jgi:prevent-host-death family protein
MERVVRASDFKARCLALLDNVARTGEPLTVTKHGKPVARVAPLETQPPRRSVMGSVTIVDPDDNLFSATDPEDWTGDWENVRRGLPRRRRPARKK